MLRGCYAVDDNGYCQLKAPALRGEYVLMTYSVDLVKQGQFVPPVSASVICECDQEYNKKVNLTVMLTNNIAQRGAQQLALEVRILGLWTCYCILDTWSHVSTVHFALPRDSSPADTTNSHSHFLYAVTITALCGSCQL